MQVLRIAYSSDLLRWPRNSASTGIGQLNAQAILVENQSTLARLLWECAVKRRRFPVGKSPTRQTLQPKANPSNLTANQASGSTLLTIGLTNLVAGPINHNYQNTL